MKLSSATTRAVYASCAIGHCKDVDHSGSSQSACPPFTEKPQLPGASIQNAHWPLMKPHKKTPTPYARESLCRERETSARLERSLAAAAFPRLLRRHICKQTPSKTSQRTSSAGGSGPGIGVIYVPWLGTPGKRRDVRSATAPAGRIIVLQRRDACGRARERCKWDCVP